MSTWRFLFGELAVLFSGSRRILIEHAAAARGTTLPSSRGFTESRRFVRSRRAIAAVYVTLGLLVPVAVAVRVVSVWWNAEGFSNALSLAITVCLSLFVGTIIASVLSLVGILLSRALVLRFVRPQLRAKEQAGKGESP